MKRHAFLSMTVVLGLGLLLGFLVVGSPSSPVSLAAPAGTTLHVQSGGETSGACDSWANACELQTALSIAVAGDEIWVKAGTYYPGTTRFDTFQLVSGVAVYGGFAGTETSREERGWETHVTILSGDIGTPDDNSDNSYHVVTAGSTVTETAVLDGFTVSGGNANGSDPDNRGGRMYNDSGSPVLTNVTFSGNSTNRYGGGISNWNGSNPTLTNVTFSGNTASWFGGGMYNYTSSPTLTNVTFSGNTAGQYGGGMYNHTSSPTLTNVTFSGNTASWGGGGMRNSYSSPTLTNCILWGNTATEISDDNSTPDVSYSLVQGGYTGAGNLDADPLFVDAANGDLHLRLDSPAIDAGDNSAVPLGVTTDLDGHPRFVDIPLRADTGSGIPPIVDMGAYEVQLPAAVFVDADATGANNGGSWGDAFTDLQDALSCASGGGEIWVAEGTYLPTTDNDRTATFQLVNGVEIYGGFDGTEVVRGERNPDPATNNTVLSGDLGDNDGPDFAYYDENSYHVVTGSGADDSAVLDGFTISGGNAEGASYTGGGMLNVGGSPTLRNLTFSRNQATHHGGGMYNYDHSSPTLTNCQFTNNVANSDNQGDGDGGGMNNDLGSNPVLSGTDFYSNTARYGGGMGNQSQSSPKLTNVTFSGNSATGQGGGMHNHTSSNPQLTNCQFTNNLAGDDLNPGYGGGMYNWGSSPTLTNVTFSSNDATEHGGGMHNDESSNPQLTNVSFSGNLARVDGGGMANRVNSNPTLTNVTFSRNTGFSRGGGIANNGSAPTLRNCILWDNGAVFDGDQIWNVDDSTPVIAYSLVQDSYDDITGSWDPALGTDDGGNIDLDPLFVDAAGPDHIAGTLDDDLRLQLTSPAIDAGDNSAVPSGVTTDLGGHGRFADVPTVVDTGNGTPPIVDMGAWEAPPGRIYVDREATGNDAGTSWTHALPDLQSAFTWAMDGVEVWVAEGTYLPGTERHDSFQLMSGVAVYGGFAATETLRTERDWQTHVTILSGDIGTPDDNSDNSYHVVTGSGTDATAVLDGFTVSGGNANGSYPFDNQGGGMYNLASSPTLTNVTFSGNSADRGGGISNWIHSNPTLTNVTFSGNSADRGGGMYNWDHSSPTLTNVAFSGNTAGELGGGMYNYSGSPTLTYVTFSGNSADWGGGMYSNSSAELTNVSFSGNLAYVHGGGMYNSSSNPVLTNVTFSGNHAGSDGGGMRNGSSSSPTLTNVTFSGNSADRGGGMYNWDHSSPTLTNVTFSGNTAGNGGGIANYTSSPTLTNCILWGNTATQIFDDSSTPVVSYSLVQGGYTGTGNIDLDPLFVDADGPDNVAGTLDDDLHLICTSPAIDAGDNSAVLPGVTTDLDGYPRISGIPGSERVDMGPYEEQYYGAEATLGDGQLMVGQAYRDGFHVTPGKTISTTIAAYDANTFYDADQHYANALTCAPTTERFTYALTGRLDARWELATGELLVGNQDVVEALEPRLTGAYPTLPAQIAELGAAKDHFVQAADAYLDLLAGELYTPALALQPGRVSPLSGEAEPYADVQRLAQAAAKKSGAYLALTERYFRQYTEASKDQARATLEEGWELAEFDLTLVVSSTQQWPGAGDNQDYQTARQALEQNIDDLQRIDSHLDEGKNPFGYDTDYVPFHPVQGTAQPDPNFEYWLGEARWDDPDHDDYVGYQRADGEFQTLLASQRELDDDQAKLTEALQDLDLEYEERLGELCGTDGGSADYEGCHGGEMGLQVDEIRAAKLRVERVTQQMENQAELIRIEQQRAAQVAGIHEAVAVMYDDTGKELADLARKEAELRFTKTEMGGFLDIVSGGLDAFDEGGTNFGPKGGLAFAAVGMLVEGLKWADQNKVGNELADVKAQQAEIEAYQQGFVKYADARIEDANSEALIKEYLLEFALLDLDLALALNELEQELARLEGMKTEIEYLLARWAEAGRDAVDLYFDPAERVFRDQQAERASKYFDLALETTYRAARALDYEMAQTWSGEEQGYALVGTDNLLTHLDDMNGVYQGWDSTGQEWCDAIKLSEAMGFVDSMVISGTQQVWTTAEEKFHQYVSNADNWVDRDGNGIKESLRLEFETSIEEPYRFFSRNVYNDKILYYNIVLMGEQSKLDVSADGTRVALRQAGTSTVRDSSSEPFGEDSFKGYSLEATPPHQVAALYNVGPGVCNETQPYAGYGFYWRSVYCTDWVLTIDATANEPTNQGDIDFTALDEIEIHVQHRDFPLAGGRLVEAPLPQAGAMTTAAKLSHLAGDPDAAHRFAGTLYAAQPERQPPQQLALLLVETGGVVSGAIESEALLGYPTDPGTGLGPALSGTVADGLFLLSSDVYTFSSEAMTHQLFLTTTTATGMTIGGEYVERIGGLTPAPLEIRGTYTLTRSFLGPQAAFSASPASGADPLEVTFIDWSQGEPTTCAWDFGDGETWAEQNPTLPYTLTHTYDLPGTYTVTLTVSSLFGSDTYTETDCVTVGRFRVYLPLVMRPAP